MNEQLRAQFEAWHEQDEHQKIVDAVLALPPEERGYEETGQLAPRLKLCTDRKSVV